MMVFWMLFSLLGLCAAGYVGFSGNVATGSEIGRFAFFGFAILFSGFLIAALLGSGRRQAP